MDENKEKFMESAHEPIQRSSSSKPKQWIVLLFIIIIALGIACVLFFLWNSKGKGEDDGGKIGYDANAVVVTDEDELQKLVDDMYAKDGQISLEYKNIANSDDGSNFNCYIANSAKNKYDMYLGIYTDVSYKEELFLTRLMKPGSGIKNFKSKKKLEPGQHNVILVFTLVENDHETIHTQTNVMYTLNVAE